MCPEDTLLSAFIDGEVPSPWREHIQAHAELCPRCSAILESYRSIDRGLRPIPGQREDENLKRTLTEAEARIRARLLTGQPVKGFGGVAWRDRPAGFWSRPIAVPLPVAAAAAVAIVFLGGLAAGFFGSRPVDTRSLAATQRILAAQASSLDDIVRYLDSRDSQQAVTITLPSEASFFLPGSPLLITTSSGLDGQTLPQEAEGGGP
jgi:anti-sigma factor RsiW